MPSYALAGLVLILVMVVCSGCGPAGPAATGGPSPHGAPEVPRLGPGVHRLTMSPPGGETSRYTLVVPQGYDGKAPVPLVVALHFGGNVTPFYGGTLLDALVRPALHDLGAVLVAPDSLGGDWTAAKNEEAVVRLTRDVMASYAIDPKRVLLTGFSMGGGGTWYLGGRHPDLFTAAVPVAGPPAGEEADWKIPAYVIHSRTDDVVPLGPTRRRAEALKARGLDVELKVVNDLSHYETARYVPLLREAVPWLNRVWGEGR